MFSIARISIFNKHKGNTLYSWNSTCLIFQRAQSHHELPRQYFVWAILLLIFYILLQLLDQWTKLEMVWTKIVSLISKAEFQGLLCNATHLWTQNTYWHTLRLAIQDLSQFSIVCQQLLCINRSLEAKESTSDNLLLSRY